MMIFLQSMTVASQETASQEYETQFHEFFLDDEIFLETISIRRSGNYTMEEDKLLCLEHV
jgi:hypothetical protein